METRAARDSQGRGGAAKRQGAQRESPLRGHQYEAEPAVDLRTGLLPARRNRESDQRVKSARCGPYQLHELLGQSTARADDGCGLCADAGDPSGRHSDHHGPRSGVVAARAPAEARRSRRCLGAPHGAAPARVLPVSVRLPASGSGAGSHSRIKPTFANQQRNLHPDGNTVGDSRVQKRSLRRPTSSTLLSAVAKSDRPRIR